MPMWSRLYKDEFTVIDSIDKLSVVGGIAVGLFARDHPLRATILCALMVIRYIRSAVRSYHR